MGELMVNPGAIKKNTQDIGTLSNLTTTEKGSLVGAVNELNTNTVKTTDIKNNLTTALAGYVLDARQGKVLGEYELISDLAALKVWRTGKVYVAIFEGATKNNGTLVTLDSAHRPPKTARGMGVSADCTSIGRLVVDAGGAVSVASATNNTASMYGQVVWTVG